MATCLLCVTSTVGESSVRDIVKSVQNINIKEKEDNKEAQKNLNWSPYLVELGHESISFKFPNLDNSFSFYMNDSFVMGTASFESDLNDSVLKWDKGYIAAGYTLDEGESAESIVADVFSDDFEEDLDEDDEDDQDMIEYNIIKRETGTVNGNTVLDIIIEYPTIKHCVHVYMVITDECAYTFLSSFDSEYEDELQYVIDTITVEKIVTIQDIAE